MKTVSVPAHEEITIEVGDVFTDTDSVYLRLDDGKYRVSQIRADATPFTSWVNDSYVLTWLNRVNGFTYLGNAVKP